MANQYFADVPKGFSVPKQVRVDYKTNIQNENTLKNLGVNNNLAFTYYEGLEIYCKEEKTKYVWREVEGIEIGLLSLHFTYPTYPAIDGINYSGKQFNFFLVNQNQISADGSETKLISGNNVTIIGQGTSLNPYTISATFQNESTFIQPGTNVTITGTGLELDPYIINSINNDLGLVKQVNNRVLAPNQTLFLINSDITGKALITKEYVDNLAIPIVDGSETKIIEGNNVLITGVGTIGNPYIINSVAEVNPLFINSTSQIEVVGNGSLENPYTFFNIGLDLKANIDSPTFTGTVTAPIIIGNLTGNSSTTTKLQTPITINNVSFDGSNSIFITDDTREPRINKQNSLLVDGTGNKFVTVDAVNTGLSLKQSTLISGTNIKTVNGNSLLGSGNITLVTDISGKEDVANKQNSLAVDGTNLKYPTVTGVNKGMANSRYIVQNDFSVPEVAPLEINESTHNAFGFICQAKNGDVLYFYRQGVSHVGDAGIIRVIKSTNGGKSFGSPTTLFTESNIDLRNLGGGVTPNGRIVIFFERYDYLNPTNVTGKGSMYSYSDDNGLLFATPIAKPLMEVPYGGMISIGENKLLQGSYGIIGVDNHADIMISSDNGSTWGTSQVIATGAAVGFSEPTFAYLGNNIILGIVRDSPLTTGFLQYMSFNNGATWTYQGVAAIDITESVSPWLNVTRDIYGKRLISLYYHNRDNKTLKVISANALDLINNGVTGWDLNTKTNLFLL